MQRPIGWLVISLAALACVRTKGHHARRAHEQATAPAAAASASSNATSSPAPRSLSFQLVKELGCDSAHLYALPEKTFVTCGQNLFFVDGNELKSDTSYERGLEREKSSLPWHVGNVVGHWPDAAWLSTNPSDDGAGYGELFHWASGRWRRVGPPRVERMTAMLPWTNQRAVAIVEPPYVHGARLVPLGNEPFAVPRFTRPSIGNERCVTRMSVEETAELEPGDVMVAGGQTCDVEPNRGVVFTGIGVERLRASSPQGEFLKLEGVPKIPLSTAWTLTALVAVSTSEAFVAANSEINQERTVGYFGHWQGANFTLQPSPFDTPVNLLWLEKPDVLWATDLKHNLWRREAGTFARVPWVKPEGDDMEIVQGWARAQNDVWLITHSKSRKTSAIYHSR